VAEKAPGSKRSPAQPTNSVPPRKQESFDQNPKRGLDEILEEFCNLAFKRDVNVKMQADTARLRQLTKELTKID
jgi:hypothetical protein